MINGDELERATSPLLRLKFPSFSAAALGGAPLAQAAKAATISVPIVFVTAVNPVEVGLVESLNRPGGNLTGVTILSVELEPKLLELVHELVPTATIVALLVNPTSPLADTLSHVSERSGRIAEQKLDNIGGETLLVLTTARDLALRRAMLRVA